jgi:predicted esterase
MRVVEHHARIARRARYYTLGAAEAAHDIWIVCHGYGQLAGRFIENFTSIAQPGSLFVAPEGLHRFYIDPPPRPAAQRRVGATWMTREDRDNDIADYVDYLDLLSAELTARAPSARVRALGFSQGTATVLRWAVRGQATPAEVVLWAGEVPDDVDWTEGARKLAQTRIRAIRGSRDENVPATVFQRNLETLKQVGLSYQMHEFDGGHKLDDAVLLALL